MNNKQIFLSEFRDFIIKEDLPLEDIFSPAAIQGFKELCSGTIAAPVTENGAILLSFMRNNKEKCGNSFTTQTLALGLNISPRAVTGIIRKLVHINYVEQYKRDGKVIYKLTNIGETINLERTSINIENLD